MKALRDLLFDILEINQRYSDEIYSKISPILQEESHSFGTKFFSDLTMLIIENLDVIHNDGEIDYLYFEKNLKTKYALNYSLKIDKDYEYEYFELICKIVKKVKQADIELANLFSSFLVGEKESKHNFTYTNKLLRFIEEKLDLEIFKNVESEYSDLGYFYNSFLKNDLNSKLILKEFKDGRKN